MYSVGIDAAFTLRPLLTRGSNFKFSLLQQTSFLGSSYAQLWCLANIGIVVHLCDGFFDESL